MMSMMDSPSEFYNVGNKKHQRIKNVTGNGHLTIILLFALMVEHTHASNNVAIVENSEFPIQR